MSRPIVGPYAIQGLLGSGGIGHVYAALDQDLGRQVALKALRPELSHDAGLLERFRNEANNLARLNHPNITTLYSLYREVTPQRQNVFMVMEMVNGETLEAILVRAGRLSVTGCLAVMAQAVAGISYAHSVGIIHRDIKPSNMMLNDAGVLKITDFGIARVQGSQRLTRHGAVVGTLNYVSPEQIKGHETDERSDLYSLACVLYEMLSGQKPFVGANEYELIRAQLEVDAEPLTASMPDLEPNIDRALLRALAKNPEDRFSSVAEFAAALGTASIQEAAATLVREQVLATIGPSDPFQQGDRLLPGAFEPTTLSALAFHGLASGQPAQEPAPPRTPRRRRTLAAAAAAVVVMLTGGGYLAYRWQREPPPASLREPSEPSAAPVAAQAGRAETAGEATVAQPVGPKPDAPQPGKPQPDASQPAAPQSAASAPPEPPAATQPGRAEPSGKPAVAQSPEPSAAPQTGPSQPPNTTAAARSAPPEPTGSGTPPASTVASQPLPPPETTSPDGGNGGSPVPGHDTRHEPPAAAATAAKTLAGEVSAYSEDGWPIIQGVTVRLDGVGPLAPAETKPVSEWIATHGNYLECTLSPPGDYRCLTRQNFDLAQAILLNGAARTSTNAAPAYRDAEAQARSAKRGVWR